jgi:hypothetical protein
MMVPGADGPSENAEENAMLNYSDCLNNAKKVRALSLKESNS